MDYGEQFERIYHEHKKLVYNLCLQYVLNPEDAADNTQEVFIKVYQHISQYDDQSASLKTWIYRIAINQCIDFLKAKKSKKRFGFLTSLFHPETDDPLDLPSSINHPGIAAEDREGLSMLLKIIYALPGNQKTAIILTRIDGLPQQEVAQIMKTSVKAVESLLQRARQTISKKLTDSEGL